MSQRVKCFGGQRNPQVPDGAIYVGRPFFGLRGSPYANPFSVKRYGLDESRRRFRAEVLPALDLAPLRGRDLACWCKPDAEWCHADDLLAEANR